MARSHWRSATGAGLLAAGLMANVGTAVAIADTGDTTGGAEKSPTNPSSPSTNHQNPLGSIVKNLTTTIQGATTAVGSLAPKVPTPVFGSGGSGSTSPGTTVPKMLSDAIRIPTTITGFSGPPPSATPPVTNPDGTPTDAPAGATGGDTTPASAAPATPKKTSPAPVTAPLATALSSTLATTTSQITHTATQVTQAIDGAVTPATAALGDSVQNLAAPVGAFAAQVTAPIPDVLSSIQALLTSTTNAIAPVTQLPTDLLSLLGAGEAPPVTGRIGTDDRAALPAGPSASLPSTRLLSAGTAAAASTAAEKATQTPPVTATALSAGTKAVAQASAVNASARATPGDVMSEGLQAFFHSYGALVIAASLSALAAAALPGLVAFLVPTVAGVGLGYRQAKAGIALRASGIARFAGSGPMGIVRSGSMISLRQSAVRVTRPARPASTTVVAVERPSQSHFAA